MRELVWVDRPRFRGLPMCMGLQCCRSPIGDILDAMKENFEALRDKEFASHVCSQHPLRAPPKAPPPNHTPHFSKVSNSEQTGSEPTTETVDQRQFIPSLKSRASASKRLSPLALAPFSSESSLLSQNPP
jgi:hypothetical protein